MTPSQSMTETRHTTYLVRAFQAVGRGLKPAEPRRLETRARALRLGQVLADRGFQVEVLAIEEDAAIDYCAEPRLVAVFGTRV